MITILYHLSKITCIIAFVLACWAIYCGYRQFKPCDEEFDDWSRM